MVEGGNVKERTMKASKGYLSTWVKELDNSKYTVVSINNYNYIDTGQSPV